MNRDTEKSKEDQLLRVKEIEYLEDRKQSTQMEREKRKEQGSWFYWSTAINFRTLFTLYQYLFQEGSLKRKKKDENDDTQGLQLIQQEEVRRSQEYCEICKLKKNGKLLLYLLQNACEIFIKRQIQASLVAARLQMVLESMALMFL